MFRAYLKPEQPPGITPTRRPATVASTFSSARNFLTSAAACSVRVSVTGAVFCVVPIWMYPSVTAQLREAGPRSQRRRLALPENGASPQLVPHATHHHRLAGHRRVLRAQHRHRLLL